jgi:hypothetical protein
MVQSGMVLEGAALCCVIDCFDYQVVGVEGILVWRFSIGIQIGKKQETEK